MFSQCPRVVPEFWKGGLGESCTILSVSLSLKREREREEGWYGRSSVVLLKFGQGQNISLYY
jgi:hypothetical protein